MKTIFSWTPLGLIVSNFDSIVMFFQSLPDRFRSLGEMTIDGLLSGITGKLSELKSTLINAAESTSNWFKETLGIASPSKVFISHGQDTINGLTQGVEQSKPAARDALQQAATQLTLKELPPKRSSSEQRPAPAAAFGQTTGLVPAKTSAGTKQITIDASLNAPITIHAAPGMDPKELTKLVAQELDRRERAQQARLRASLKDTE